jgi:2-oxoacid:acceptor oxidoreductase gamma subunit (pyruvate/2-ketoisovalerate family)/2-oxoacid:acceptor oxidoreductase delta subunit (pyruvate/2-ketoisovalerate family)
MEIRLHGRGGQGGVTCVKILAALYARLGRHVQAFGDYGGERSGAPVRAYLRVSDSPVASRNKVLRPDHLLVLDPTLLDERAAAGLNPGGLLLVNSPEPPSALGARFAPFRVATVDATAIARRHGIGSRSLVIVNTTVVGAVVRLLDLPLPALEPVYRALGLEHDLGAARQAFDEVRSRAPTGPAPAPLDAADQAVPAAGGAPAGGVLDVTELREGAASQAPTGGWRSQRPEPRLAPAPCNASCPAGNDVVGFVQALARGAALEAAEILGRTMPLPGVCGRVCPGWCMPSCNRTGLDGAVQVRALERWLGDHGPPPAARMAQPRQVRRLAVLGGGPAGLSAAFFLRLAGHEVTLLDAAPRLGGLLEHGIPRFRLPRAVLDREIERVLGLGVRARLGEHIDAAGLERLCAEHEGLVVATGRQRSVRWAVAGSELGGVEQGLDFLRRSREEPAPSVRGQVVVLGGGNTAIDCARTALRLGAEHVTVAYRRSRDEMPAIAEEVSQALEEGIELRVLRGAVGVRGRERVEAVTLCEMELGPLDASGRRRPVPTERLSEQPCDALLVALGQLVDDGPFPADWRLGAGPLARAGATPPVLAAGDLATGEGTVAHAIGDGRRAAARLLAALGEAATPFEQPTLAAAVGPTDVRLERFAPIPAATLELEPVARRVRSFDEVAHGLGSSEEAVRCFGCGRCTECDRCIVYCPDGIIRREPGAPYRVDYDFCKGCGLCVVECPRAAIRMVTG